MSHKRAPNCIIACLSVTLPEWYNYLGGDPYETVIVTEPTDPSSLGAMTHYTISGSTASVTLSDSVSSTRNSPSLAYAC